MAGMKKLDGKKVWLGLDEGGRVDFSWVSEAFDTYPTIKKLEEKFESVVQDVEKFVDEALSKSVQKSVGHFIHDMFVQQLDETASFEIAKDGFAFTMYIPSKRGDWVSAGVLCDLSGAIDDETAAALDSEYDEQAQVNVVNLFTAKRQLVAAIAKIDASLEQIAKERPAAIPKGRA